MGVGWLVSVIDDIQPEEQHQIQCACSVFHLSCRDVHILQNLWRLIVVNLEQGLWISWIAQRLALFVLLVNKISWPSRAVFFNFVTIGRVLTLAFTLAFFADDTEGFHQYRYISKSCCLGSPLCLSRIPQKGCSAAFTGNSVIPREEIEKWCQGTEDTFVPDCDCVWPGIKEKSNWQSVIK